MYFYFSHRDKLLSQLSEVLVSCTAQIGYEPRLAPLVIDFYDQYHQTVLPTASKDVPVPELKDILCILIKALALLETKNNDLTGDVLLERASKQAFLVLDALDEVPVGELRDGILGFIRTLREAKLNHLHILITSRLDEDIEHSLQSIGTEDVESKQRPVEGLSDKTPLDKFPLAVQKIGSSDINSDIELLVKAELKKNGRLKLLDPVLKDEIIKSLTHRKSPMFKWAALQLGELKKLPITADAEQVRKTLQTLPRTLDSTYHKGLAAVPEQYSGIVHNALRWLVYSRRPIQVNELLEGCAFDTAPRVSFNQTRNVSIKDISSLLSGFLDVGPLIQVDSLPTQTVSLAHFSVKEYLLRYNFGPEYDLEGSPSHKFLAACCFEYLIHTNTPEASQKLYPLRQYAWDSWAWHCVRTKCPDGTADAWAENIRETVSYSSFREVKDTANFLYTTIWALVDWPLPKHGNELFPHLVIPYFYQEYIKSDREHVQPVGSGDYGLWKSLRYRHQWLRRPSQQLRLIEVLPSKDEFAELRGKVHVVDSIDSRPFEVFTYVWRSGHGQQAWIRLNGQPLEIPPGLAPALQKLRNQQQDGLKLLWIDAISIDQDNSEERKIVIARMPEIFRKASKSAVFIETSTEAEDGIAVELLRAMDACLFESQFEGKDLKQLKLLCQKEPNPIRLVVALFDRPLWSRLWTLQEVVLPDDVTVFFGQHQITINLLERLLYHHNRTEHILMQLPESEPDLDLFQCDTWRSAIEMASIRVELRDRGSIGWLRALFASRYLSGFKIKDRFYALLSLVQPTAPIADELAEIDESEREAFKARQESQGFVYPDYQKSSDVVYTEMSVFLLSFYKDLDLLSFLCSDYNKLELQTSWKSGCDVPEEEFSLPSWVSTFKPTKSNPLLLLTSKFTYPVIDDVFNACHEQTSAKWERESGLLLVLQGFVVDQISYVHPELPEISFPSVIQQRLDIFQHGGFRKRTNFDLPSGQTAIESYWRTVMADQLEIGKRLPPSSQSGNLIPPRSPEDEALLVAEDGANTGLQFSKGRKFFLTKSGRMGLGPMKAALGDSLVICPGGKVVYVLRPLPVEWFELIGDWYVHIPPKMLL
ncbi:hypothetical protein NA56DRAFT_21714 [Hyaloscypha hepaticicola]|uniref:Uncharacterized protein n=1 Tax=Hyaloscypha hepaticicola TaxID=2082293 RepID=A0A2J6QR26_9HELO|nr:hypothetical protein NA56DRAFT_21714 [Hyaloscypha hepaticicola]